jgi:hypothetical protein
MRNHNFSPADQQRKKAQGGDPVTEADDGRGQSAAKHVLSGKAEATTGQTSGLVHAGNGTMRPHTGRKAGKL